MTQHNDTQHQHPVSVCWESHFYIVRLNVIMPSVVVLNVVSTHSGRLLFRLSWLSNYERSSLFGLFIIDKQFFVSLSYNQIKPLLNVNYQSRLELTDFTFTNTLAFLHQGISEAILSSTRFGTPLFVLTLPLNISLG
jgi:hypothetical protein